jgi:hypothetical protein
MEEATVAEATSTVVFSYSCTKIRKFQMICAFYTSEEQGNIYCKLFLKYIFEINVTSERLTMKTLRRLKWPNQATNQHYEAVLYSRAHQLCSHSIVSQSSPLILILNQTNAIDTNPSCLSEICCIME